MINEGDAHLVYSAILSSGATEMYQVPTDGKSATVDSNGREVAVRIAQLIASGEIGLGQRIGSERDLAIRFNVSRGVLRSALNLLEESGTIRRTRGRSGGTFVNDKRVERDLSSIVGLPYLLKSQGIIAGTRVIRTAITEANGVVASALGLAIGELVFEILRIRLANGSPISLESACFPVDRFPGLLDQQLGGSLYEVIEEFYGVKPIEAIEKIEVKISENYESKILGVDIGVPLFVITRTTVDSEGVAFEYSIDLFRSDRTLIYARSFGATALSTVSRPWDRAETART